MSYDLVRLSFLTNEEKYKVAAERQLDFLLKSASQNPTNHAMFLIALLEYEKPPTKVTVVMGKNTEISSLPFAFPHDAIITLLQPPTEEYALKNGKTTYYICKNSTCLSPTNDLHEQI